MKSIALSLLVAASLTLGAANALAEMPATNVFLSAAQVANREADAHALKAAEYRAVARSEQEKAKISMKIAIDDATQGFWYEAGVQRAKAAAHEAAAQKALQNATREDNIAAVYRAKAAEAAAQSHPTAINPAITPAALRVPVLPRR